MVQGRTSIDVGLIRIYSEQLDSSGADGTLGVHPQRLALRKRSDISRHGHRNFATQWWASAIAATHRLAVEAERRVSEKQQSHLIWLGAAVQSPWVRPIVDSPFLPSNHVYFYSNFSAIAGAWGNGGKLTLLSSNGTSPWLWIIPLAALASNLSPILLMLFL
jgi:hypothetical protein